MMKMEEIVELTDLGREVFLLFLEIFTKAREVGADSHDRRVPVPELPFLLLHLKRKRELSELSEPQISEFTFVLRILFKSRAFDTRLRS
jgi:hypothetical protein